MHQTKGKALWRREGKTVLILPYYADPEAPDAHPDDVRLTADELLAMYVELEPNAAVYRWNEDGGRTILSEPA